MILMLVRGFTELCRCGAELLSGDLGGDTSVAMTDEEREPSPEEEKEDMSEVFGCHTFKLGKEERDYPCAERKLHGVMLSLQKCRTALRGAGILAVHMLELGSDIPELTKSEVGRGLLEKLYSFSVKSGIEVSYVEVVTGKKVRLEDGVALWHLPMPEDRVAPWHWPMPSTSLPLAVVELMQPMNDMFLLDCSDDD